MKNVFILLSLLGFPGLNYAQTINTTASKVSFEISNMGLNTVEGSFGGMKGTIVFNPNDLSNSRFEVCIDAATVNTGNSKRDKHLKTEDFFEVEKYPTICFQSTSIVKTSEGFKTVGELDMHGLVKAVEILFTFSNNTFSGTLELRRRDYGIGPSGGFMVGKTVNLRILCAIN